MEDQDSGREIVENDAKKISDCPEQDFGEVIKRINANLAIKRLVHGEITRACLSKPKELQTAADKQIQDLVNEQNTLVAKLLAEKAECDELKDRWFHVWRDCFKLRNEKMQLVREIEEYQEKIDTPQLKSAINHSDSSQQLDDVVGCNLKLANTLRIVFQKLILGSGINWAEDDELMHLMLELGRELVRDETQT